MMDRNASSSDVHPVSSRRLVRGGLRDEVAISHQQQVTAVVGFVQSHGWKPAGVVPARARSGELLPQICPQHRVQTHSRLVENQ